MYVLVFCVIHSPSNSVCSGMYSLMHSFNTSSTRLQHVVNMAYDHVILVLVMYCSMHCLLNITNFLYVLLCSYIKKQHIVKTTQFK